MLLIRLVLACAFVAVPLQAMHFNDQFPDYPFVHNDGPNPMDLEDEIQLIPHFEVPEFHGAQDPEVDERKGQIKSLKEYALDALVPHVLAIFKQDDRVLVFSDEKNKILIPERFSKIPCDMHNSLSLKCMFQYDGRILRRNRALIWLLQKCKMRRSMCIYNDELFFRPQAQRDMRKVEIVAPKMIQVSVLSDHEHPNNQKFKPLYAIEHEDLVRSAQFSQDGAHLYVITQERSIYDYDAATGELIHECEVHGRFRAARHLLLAPDQESVLYASMNKIVIHDMCDGQPIVVLVDGFGMEFDINHVHYSSDGNRIYVICRDGLVIDEENLEQNIDQAVRDAAIRMHMFDITEFNTVMNYLSSITLEHLLTLEVVYEIFLGREDVRVLYRPHIWQHYCALPEKIRSIIEEALPAIRLPQDQTPGTPDELIDLSDAEPPLKISKLDE